jgi:hypothetical protein
VSYETKLTSGNEAAHNQGAMREVGVKTATERNKKLLAPAAESERLCRGVKMAIDGRREIGTGSSDEVPARIP